MISRTFRKPFHVFFMPKNLSSHHIYKCILSLKTQRKIKSKVQSWSIPPLYLSSQAVYWLQPDEDGSKGKKCLNKDNYKLGIFLLQVMFVHLLRGHKLEPLEELPKIPVRDKNCLIQLRDMFFVFIISTEDTLRLPMITIPIPSIYPSVHPQSLFNHLNWPWMTTDDYQ